MDAEDLMSVGIMGPMDAMDKYDPTREAKFKPTRSFASEVPCSTRSVPWTGFRAPSMSVLPVAKTYIPNSSIASGRPPSDQEVGQRAQDVGRNWMSFSSLSGCGCHCLDDLGVQDADGHKIISMLTDSINRIHLHVGE